MTQIANFTHTRVGAGGLLGLLLLVGLLAASPAAANFETVKTFKEEGHELQGRTGAAVNVTGAGGVLA